MTNRRRLLIAEAKRYNLNVKMWVDAIKYRERMAGKTIKQLYKLRKMHNLNKKANPFSKHWRYENYK